MSFLIESRPIILAAGGTGGHVYPALAVAKVLLQRAWPIAIITDDRGTAFGNQDFVSEIHHIKAASPTGSLYNKLVSLTQLGAGFLQARAILKKIKAVAAIGFGGYPSVPTMCAAAQIGLPTIIHEQNAVLGRANRILIPSVTKIAISFDKVKGIRPKAAQKIVKTGNPVRSEISEIGKKSYSALSLEGKLNVLVFGGSQGAQILSQVVPRAMASLSGEFRSRLTLTQQCRPEDLDQAQNIYDAAHIQTNLQPYFNNMPELLSAANLVIARAGASTISELVAAKRPAILVPYPHATDDHQTANASAITSSGASWCIPEHSFTAKLLARKIQELMDNPNLLADAAAKSKCLSKLNAAENLADTLEKTIRKRNNGGAVA